MSFPSRFIGLQDAFSSDTILPISALEKDYQEVGQDADLEEEAAVRLRHVLF